MKKMNLKRSVLMSMASATALLVAGCGDQGSDSSSGEMSSGDNSVEAIHERVITLDTHVDIHEDMTFDPLYDPGVDTNQQVDLGKMERGGLDSAFFIVYVGQDFRTPEGYALAEEKARRKFSAIHRMTESYSDRIGLANTPDEFDEIAASGRKVAMIGIENGFVIGKKLELVEEYYNMGARYMTLAHFGHNDICDSSGPSDRLGDAEEEHGGVSEFGYQVIDEMNRLGMMVDISHVSVKCMMQATQYSKAPVIASHSGSYAINPHIRNLTDEQLMAVKENNGVVQAVALDVFVKDYPERQPEVDALRAAVAMAAGDAEWDEEKHAASAQYTSGMAAIEAKYPRATVKDFVDHIDHMVSVIGIDHVGIVSDFDGGGGVVGWDDATETMNVTAELVARGYTEEEISKLWSDNTLALWRRVDAAAAALQ